MIGPAARQLAHALTPVIAMYRRIITYVLLCGYSPFRSESKMELTKETTKGRVEFHDRYWQKVSDQGERGRGSSAMSRARG